MTRIINIRLRSSILCLFFLFNLTGNYFSALGQNSESLIPEKPNPPRLVNDYTNSFLSSEEQLQLEQKLQKFAKETSNQIVIVIFNDIGDVEAWEFATQLGKKWGVGQAKMDNGVVILVVPKGPSGKRKLAIAVGQGLEGAIPDIATKKIREQEMYPYFKKGAYYTGLDKATDVLMALAKGEYNTNEYAGKKNKNDVSTIIIIIVIIIILFVFIKRGGGGRGGSGMDGFLLGALLGRMSGGGGHHGGGSSGGDFGGFGGFGGGDFGGGGSSGDW